MQKNLFFSAALLLSTYNVQGIEHGAPIDVVAFPSLVEMNCTGTVIAGKWVLTAAHCTSAETNGLQRVTLAGANLQAGDNGNSWWRFVSAINEIKLEGQVSDISLWELSQPIYFNKVLFLSNEVVTQSLNNTFSLYGFGMTGLRLNSATYQINSYFEQHEEILLFRAKTQATSISGDSGGPYLLDDKIVAIHNRGGWQKVTRGKTSDKYHGTLATRIAYVQDQIINTINGWHYPTIANTAPTGGNVTIEVQSLHNSAFMDKAYSEGDINIVGGTCLGKTVQPFDICTYVVESTKGDEGKLFLNDEQIITVNNTRPPAISMPIAGDCLMGRNLDCCLPKMSVFRKAKR